MLYSLEIGKRTNTIRKQIPPLKKDSLRFSLLAEPQPKELTQVAKQLKISKKLLTKTERLHYARILHENPLTLAFIDASIKEERVERTVTTIILRKKDVLVIAHKNSGYYKRLFNDLVKQTKEKKPADIGELLYYFLLDDVEENYEVLQKVEKEIIMMENKIASKKNIIELSYLLKLKKKISNMHAEFSSLVKLLNRLKSHGKDLGFLKQSKELLNNVNELLLHQLEVLAIQQGRFTELITLETINTSEEVRMASEHLNKLTTKMTGIATIFLIPLFITSIYGMNFQNLPFATYEHGFFIIISITLLAMILTYLFLKQTKVL